MKEQQTEKITFDHFLININRFFIMSEEMSESEKNSLLGKVWEILDLLCPENSKTELGVTVSSQTLVDLGLVSEKTGAIIAAINKRKDHGEELQNRINFRRTGKNEIMILKTFVTEELTEASFRKDKMMSEKIVITKEGPTFKVDMWLNSDKYHIHHDNITWVPSSRNYTENDVWNNEKSNDWVMVDPTARDLNRTLALIVEGFKPGYLGKQKLF